MNIDDYTNYKEKTIAEFKVAITEAEQMISICTKKKDIIGALKAYKLKVKLEYNLSKKRKDGAKNGYATHKRT